MDQAAPSGWTSTGRALTRTFTRADFVDALAFVLAVARPAEEANHHPDIDIRYKTVHLSVSTHSAGHQLTPKDFALAEKINDLDEAEIRSICDELRGRLGA